MNPQHREAFLDAFKRQRTTSERVKSIRRSFVPAMIAFCVAHLSAKRAARQSAAITLALLAAFIAGMGMIEYGLWPHQQAAAVVIGVFTGAGAIRVLTAVMRIRK